MGLLLPITDYGLRMSTATGYSVAEKCYPREAAFEPRPDYQSPITDDRSPITNYRLLSPDYRLPITDYPLLITDSRLWEYVMDIITVNLRRG